MDSEDVLLLCVGVDGTKAEAEEIKASARMLESFMIAIDISIDEYYGTSIATMYLIIDGKRRDR